MCVYVCVCVCVCECVCVCVSAYALQQIKCIHIIRETAQPICHGAVTSNMTEP